MKRWYLAAVAGLAWFAPVSAQEGTLAPTAPVVPAPVLKNGAVLPATGSGIWGTGSRSFTLAKWSPFRNPATASVTDPLTPSVTGYSTPTPVLAPPVSGTAGSCDAGCGSGHKRERAGWDRLKAWLCYHPSKTELPKLRPVPYTTSLIGMFPCSPVPYGGGCATAANSPYAPPILPQGQPLGPPQPYMPPQGPPMPQPTPPGGASPVMMPSRGVQGAAIQPTWQGRTSPAPAGPGIAGYRFASPSDPVVNTALKVPAPK